MPCTKSRTQPKSLWERACSRKRFICGNNVECDHAFAGKPGSHRLPCPAQNLGQNQNPCGSGLARESGISAAMNVECDYAFAGKPGSHRLPCPAQNLGQNQNPCGSGLARESGISAAMMLNVTTPSRASPAPTDCHALHKIPDTAKIPVGASLLAKARDPSTEHQDQTIRSIF
jgi:hypothetical protein